MKLGKEGPTYEYVLAADATSRAYRERLTCLFGVLALRIKPPLR